MTAGEGAAWADAVREARELEAEHPGWRVRPARRRDGIGLEAVRDEGRTLALIGEAGEVRAALERLDRQASSTLL